MSYSKYRRTKKEWLIFSLIWAGISVALGLLFYKSIAGILIILPFGIVAERFDRKRIIKKQKDILSHQFIEFLQVIMSSLKAGRSLERAICSSHDRLYSIYTDDDFIMKEIVLMESGLNMNIPIEDILYDFGERSGIDDIGQFAEVCKVSKRAGGNLVKVMEHTVSCIVNKAEMEKEIQTFISGKKMESKFMTLILPGILLYMNLSMPDMMHSLYSGIMGRFAMTGILIGYIGCYFWFERITSIKV